MNYSGYTVSGGVYVNNALAINNAFEEQYIAVREKEGRIYNDQELSCLPDVPDNHRYFTEWGMRRKSANRLFNYLAKKNKQLNILEVGCGNGWLSNYLARLKGCHLTGLDINFTELQQAARVFRKENLVFVYDNLPGKLWPGTYFDMIVFAASIQYFPSARETIKTALAGLNKEGEVHILDTNFYKADEVRAARERTERYYESLGFPEFSPYYYHHSFDDLKPFAVDTLYNPASLKNRFVTHKNPFLWLRIKEK